ncbi:MAG TPA: alkaline phosphatase family protein [Myxococcota bacterium]|nr:alkaline phosphatase family protein [Myxococcota bacterium]
MNNVRIAATRTVALLAAVASLTACKKSPGTTAPQPPRLTVLIVIDQLRGDEIDAYSTLWHYGMHTLRDMGRDYAKTFHTHGRLETAAGHATLGTGELPRYNGVVDKSMYIPAQGKQVEVCHFGATPCDPNVLLVPTLGDRLKAAVPNARVVALAEKDRSATLLGGKRADLVAWIAGDRIGLVGRTHGVPGLPGWLDEFFGRIAAGDRIARLWELPRLPEPFASRPDSAPGESDCGHGLTFPHRITTTDPAALVHQWRCTPDSDRAITELALYVARRMELGTDDTPDLLLVSLSAVDLIGHSYGYESLERVAVLTELDRQLGDLVEGLKQLVGPRLLVALSADHGVAPKIPAARAAGHASGRVPDSELTAAVEKGLAGFGAGPHVADLAFPFLYLTEGPDKPARARAAVAALKAHPAVYKAWTPDALAADPDPIAALMVGSYNPTRGGDVIIVHREYFQSGSSESGAQHESPWAYDRHVPGLLWGDGVTPGRVESPVAVIDLIRTLSDRLGLPPDPHGGEPLP